MNGVLYLQYPINRDEEVEFISSNQANTASIDVLPGNSLERMWRGLVRSSSMVVADYSAHRAERKLTWVHWAAQQFKSDFEVPYRIRQVLDGIGTVMTIPSCDICNEAMTAID